MTPLLLALTFAAPVPKDFQKGAPKLNGEWAFVGSEIDGVPGSLVQKMVWRFDGETLTIRENAPGMMATTTIPIKPDAKPVPMGIVFVGDENHLGVFEVKDNTLVICKGMEPGIRPTNLDGGKGIVRWTFKRVDPKK